MGSTCLPLKSHSKRLPRPLGGVHLNRLTLNRPSAFVRSDEGARAQKRVYDELSQKLEKISPGIMAKV